MSDSPTATRSSGTSRRRASPGLRFVLTAAVFSVSLFGILRIPFVEQNLLLPFTKAQHGVACRIGGDPTAPISVGLSCSAADVIALCLGFVLAFPVAWRKRLVGAVVGLLLIAAVNTVRIATLSHAVRNTRWFDLLHVYIWPAVLLIVVSVYVFLWMNRALTLDPSATTKRSKLVSRWSLSQPSVRFVLLTLLFVALYVGSSGWWMSSPGVERVAEWVAAAGASLIHLLGGEATASGVVLRTANGSFRVTPECIMTPLIPAYFAAVFALPLAPRRRALYLLAALPVFFVLGAARLLVLAFPARMVGSHLMAIHGFFQILVGVLLVVAAALITRTDTSPRRAPWGPIAAGTLAGTAVAVMVGLTYNRALFGVVSWLHELIGHTGHDFMDAQGALLLMAPYQLGLFVGLWLALSPRAAFSRLTAGLALLAISQVMVLVAAGEWATHTGMTPHIAVIRAWSVVSVLALTVWLLVDTRSLLDRPTLTSPRPQHG